MILFARKLPTQEEKIMYYGDVIGLLIATFGTGVVIYYAKDEPRMRIVTRVLISVIIFLWVGFGLLWLN